MSFDILNPGGRDPTQDFSTGLGKSKSHPPINYHAYAACMRGRFACRLLDLRAPVVLLLLRGNLAASLRAAQKLTANKIPFFISWKESGRHQIANALSVPRILERFMAVSKLASGFLASTPWLIPVYHAAGLSFGKFIPTPYPMDLREWDFQIPMGKRSGIFLGTREFFTPSRNHAVAVFSACNLAFRLGTYVTCVNTEGWRGRALLDHLDAGRGVLKIVDGKLPYRDYLKLLAKHRVVFQFDRSGTPGQVTGDAALCGIPSLGGDGAIDGVLNTIFSQLEKQADLEAALQYAQRLLTDGVFYAETTNALRRRALEVLSFEKGAQTLRALIAPIVETL